VIAHVPAARLSAGRNRRDHPEWWVYAAAAAAWGVVILGGTSHPAVHAGHSLGAVAANPAHEAWAAALMSLAMMAPLAAPAARYVALAGRTNRRTRGPLVYVGAYVGAWSIAALALSVLVAAVSSLAGPTVVVLLVTAGAAAWQLTRMKRTALIRCARSEPMGGRGWRADLACARFGFRSARSCVPLCWGMMALVIATDHALLVALAVFGLQIRERSTRRDVARFGTVALASIGFAVALLPGPINAAGPVAARDSVLVCPLIVRGDEAVDRPSLEGSMAAGR
jgi:predicted metal-binding membrane protein